MCLTWFSFPSLQHSPGQTQAQSDTSKRTGDYMHKTLPTKTQAESESLWIIWDKHSFVFLSSETQKMLSRISCNATAAIHLEGESCRLSWSGPQQTKGSWSQLSKSQLQAIFHSTFWITHLLIIQRYTSRGEESRCFKALTAHLLPCLQVTTTAKSQESWSGRAMETNRSLRVAWSCTKTRSSSRKPASTSCTARRRSSSPATTVMRRERETTSSLSATGSGATQSPSEKEPLWWARWGQRVRTRLQRGAAEENMAGTPPFTWGQCFTWTKETNCGRRPTSCLSWTPTSERLSSACLHFERKMRRSAQCLKWLWTLSMCFFFKVDINIYLHSDEDIFESQWRWCLLLNRWCWFLKII